jgi:hypothetical protein
VPFMYGSCVGARRSLSRTTFTSCWPHLPNADSLRTSDKPLKASLREMAVKSQRLLYPALPHNEKRNAIGKGV